MLLSALQVLVGQEESQISSQFQESPLLGIVPPTALSTPRHTLSQALILCCLCSWLQSPGLFLSVPYASITPRFMEFEAEEVMQIQKLQWMQGVQGLPPPVPPKLDPQGSSAQTVCPQPGTHVPTGVPSKGNMGQGMTAGPMWILFLQEGHWSFNQNSQ